MTRVVNIAQSGGNNVTMRNRVINGAMQVWQRATSQSSAGYGSVDRWILNSNNSTLTQSTDVPAGFRYSAQLVGTSASNAQITQRIESLNCDNLAGNGITVSFWAKSTAGATQLGVYVQYANSQDNFGSTTSVGTTQLITLTSAWTQYSVTFTSNAPSGVANGLQLGLFRSGTESSTTFFTGIQLEAGTTATPFEQRLYGTELALCQRYYSTTTGNCQGYAPGTGSANDMGTPVYFPVTMRANPTITITSTVAFNSGVTVFCDSPNFNYARYYIRPNATGNQYDIGRLITLSAEL